MAFLPKVLAAQSAYDPDYDPSQQEAAEALAQAEEMNKNLREFGTIDRPINNE